MSITYYIFNYTVNSLTFSLLLHDLHYGYYYPLCLYISLCYVIIN